MRTRRKNSAEGVRQAYLEWLCRIIDKRKRSLDPEYRELATELHSIEFYDILPNDDNRVMDGLDLRRSFIEKGEYTDYSALDGSCTMLEMLVALAQRMNDILFRPSNGDQTAKWFWLLIRNLRLTLYLPDDPEAEANRQANRTIIRKFIERKYDINGRGGLFPLKNPLCDQRKAEIWYQMQAYLQENFE